LAPGRQPSLSPRGGGRKARALEIDPTYVDVAVRRWQAYTGKSAILAGSGKTFEAVEEQRVDKPAAA
jgi:DNA modification methylase